MSPCSDGRDYMTARELATVNIQIPYKEVFGEETGGDSSRLDEDTARLCEHIKTYGLPFTASWSLKYWWEDHQKMDRRREILEKLTPEEREILGV